LKAVKQSTRDPVAMIQADEAPDPLPNPPAVQPADGRPSGGFSDRTAAAAGAPHREGSPAGEPPEISSDLLLGGRSEIRIRHRGEVYRLSLTRAGKLILHK